MTESNEESPIESGWRGNLNGVVRGTNTTIQVRLINLEIDNKTAWALCNLLFDKDIEKSTLLEEDQKTRLISLGAAIGRLIDHPATNNGGREIIK